MTFTEERVKKNQIQSHIKKLNKKIPENNLIERVFKLKKNGTNVRTELIAGLTTFVTMSYIIFVNSFFLSEAGIPHDAAIAATIIASAFASILMGLYGNFPIALAPGMGLNAFFTYTIVHKMGIPWQTALGAVFISGVIFLLLTVLNVRQTLVNSIPKSLRSAVVVGIGLFITFIGLKNSGIIVSAPATFLGLGNLSLPPVLLSIFGLFTAALLLSRRVKGALLISIILTTVAAMFFHINGQGFPQGISSIVSAPPSVAPTFMKLDIMGALSLGIINLIFSFCFVDLFDSLGTFVGVTRKAGLMDEQGNVPGMNRAFVCDAVATTVGSVLGTCTTTSYIESAAGIEEGGKTGLTAVTVGLLFLAALFFSPLVKIVPPQATAPALIIVGILMVEEITHVNFKDFTEFFPAILTMFLMPLTFSIAQGIALGFTAYTLIKILSGKTKLVSPVMYVLTALFLVQFIFFKF